MIGYSKKITIGINRLETMPCIPMLERSVCASGMQNFDVDLRDVSLLIAAPTLFFCLYHVIE